MKMNRKKWIILGGIVIAVAALGAGAYAVFLAPPGKQDFAQAKADGERIVAFKSLEHLQKYSTKLVEARREGKTQRDLFDAAASERTAVIKALDGRMEYAKKLSQSRVLRDDEVKKSHDVYADRETKFQAYMRGYVSSFPVYLSSFSTCEDIFQVTRKTGDVTKYAELHKAAGKDCLEDLTALSSSRIPPYANFAKEFKRIVEGRQGAFDIVAKDTSAMEAQLKVISELNRDFNAADPTEATAKYRSEQLFHGELNRLIALLDKKAKAAK